MSLKNFTYELPNNWMWCSLSQLTKQITDGTHKTPTYVNIGVPFLSIVNISSGTYDNNPKFITFDEHKILSARCKPEIDDILLCRIGTLGKPYINKLNFEFSIFVSLGLIKLIDKKMTTYIYYVLNTPNSYSFIDYVKVGGGTHTFKINIEDIGKFPIPLPPLEEQTRINKKLSFIIEQINHLFC